MMLRLARNGCALVALGALAFAAGCGEDADSPQPTVTREAATPTATAQDSDGTPTTGIEAVDRAINAVLASDRDGLLAQVSLTSIACVATAEGIGGPPLCRPGEAEGTEVDVLPMGTCEGFYLREDEIPQSLESLNFDAAEVYGVYPAPAEFFPPGGDYVLVFEHGEGATGSSAFELIVSDAGIVGMLLGCAQTPAQMVEFQRLADPILPPAD
jgi:hypothetical protein